MRVIKPSNIPFLKHIRNRIPAYESVEAITVQGIKGVLKEDKIIALNKKLFIYLVSSFSL